MDLLKALFGQITTTATIAHEFDEELPDWVRISVVENIQLQYSLDVDPGEASAIALALECQPSLLIIDDKKGRKVARKLQLNITGSLGVFLKAKRQGIIPEIKPIIEKIRLTNFWYAEAVLQEILTLAGE